MAMTIEEEMNAMLQGKFTEEVLSEEDKAELESEEQSDEIGDEIADTQPDDTNEESNSLEDTDTQTDESTESETNEPEVAQEQETDSDDKVVESEDTQTDEVKEDTDESKEDEPETDSDKVDYKQALADLEAKYKEAKAFQDKVTSSFKANGKVVEGITDPDKIIKNMQMSVGLTNKLKGYKSVKPFIEPLEARGLMQDTEKFDMLMKLADGDKEALKYYLDKNQIDPLDIDLSEGINYNAESTLPSPAKLQFEEYVDTAASYGVADKFEKTILNDWDQDSAAKLFDKGGEAISNALVQQMSNGVYDEVMSIAESMKITDPSFSTMSSFDQYNAASNVYNARLQQQPPIVQEQPAQQVEEDTAKIEQERLAAVEAEKQRLIQEEAEAKYKKMLEDKEKELEELRAKAVQASTPVAPVEPKQTQTIPSGNDFRKEFEALQRFGRV